LRFLVLITGILALAITLRFGIVPVLSGQFQLSMEEWALIVDLIVLAVVILEEGLPFLSMSSIGQNWFLTRVEHTKDR